ncbi:oligosaccharide flippase family protein [uncultured Sphingomonas sp.]|uniref:oligosaccharide flippase family protein n=1 Tax=uncultured Sphingomonas sp. TaxID=158754 RepID=UPI0035CBAAB5
MKTRAATTWAGALRNPSAMIIANTGMQSVLRMGSNIVLARLLAPDAFALIAITSLILTGLQMVSDVGIAVIALREGEMSRENEHKLWTMQLLRGFFVGLLMLAAAVPIGWLYEDANLRDALIALALMPVLQGAQSLYPVLALGHRRLLPSTLLEIGSRMAGIVASILIAAFISPTVWSLVIGTLAGTAFSTIGSHFLAGYRPRFVIDRRYIANQWRYARWIQVSSTLYFLGGQVDKPLFPFLFGMTTLGIYGIGAALAAMPAQITQRWSASVFYPLTVQLLRGNDAARAQLLRVRTTMLLYTAVMTLTVVAISPTFFMLLYEPRYHAAAQFTQILAIGIFFDTAESSLRHMPLVEGVPQFEVWAVVVKLVAFVIAAAVVVALGGDAFSYTLAVAFGAVVGHLFMLSVCVRRGYLRAGLDLLLMSGLILAAALLYFAPLPRTSTLALLAEGATVVILAGTAMMLVFRRRGLPSLPAEPAPSTLREVAEEELGTSRHGPEPTATH